MNATVLDAPAVPEIQVRLLPRPGTPERRHFDETGEMPENFSDSSMELTWCLSDEARDRIKRDHIELFMLVAVENNGFEKNRQLVPFGKGYCQVMFPSIGLNTVHVTGVWGWEVKKELLDKNYRNYDYYVIERYQPGVEAVQAKIDAYREEPEDSRFAVGSEGDIEDLKAEWEVGLRKLINELHELRDNTPHVARINLARTSRLEGEATDSVTVDASMFATHKPITKWLANFYPVFKNKPSPDGCKDRERAYVITLPTISFYMLYLLVKSVVSVFLALIGLFFGVRGQSYKPIYRPNGLVPADVWRPATSSVWWTKADGKGRDFFDPLGWMNPPLITLSGMIAAATIALYERIEGRLGWTDRFVHWWTAGPWWFYTVVVLGPAIVGLVVLLFAFVIAGIGLLTKTSPVAWFNDKRADRKLRKETEKRQKYEKRIDLLTCNTGEALTRSVPKRPILMRPIEYGKMRVCKPNPR